MKIRLFGFVGLYIFLVSILAFLMRGVVEARVILPLAKVIWMVKGYYGAFSQADLLGGLTRSCNFDRFSKSSTASLGVGRRQNNKYEPTARVSQRDGVLAPAGKGWNLSKSGMSRISWGNLRWTFLTGVEPGMKYANHLEGSDWSPPPDVNKFLEAALTTNYTDYPRTSRVVGSLSPSFPLDQYLEPVVKYLELLLEKENG